VLLFVFQQFYKIKRRKVSVLVILQIDNIGQLNSALAFFLPLKRASHWSRSTFQS
jgi:hypothetical protein